MTPRRPGALAVIALARPTFDLDRARMLVDAATASIAAAGWVIATTPVPLTLRIEDLDEQIVLASNEDVSAIVVLQATFTDATMAIRIAETSTPRPVVFWSFPEPRTGGPLRANALCGANLAAYSLRRRRHDAAFIHIEPDHRDAAAALEGALDRARRPLRTEWPAPPDSADVDQLDLAAARNVAARIRRSHIGLVGEPPIGFEPCEYDPDQLVALAGASVDRTELPELFARAEQVTSETVDEIRSRVSRDLDVDDGGELEGLERSLRLYGGLRRMAVDRGWSAVATRCWPECPQQFGAAICASQAMLTADGVPAMCEADVYGGLTALVLSHFADRDPFVADVVDVDPTSDTSTVWHCGQASIELADPRVRPTGIRHPNHHRALLQQFALRPGPVTIARVSRAGGRPAIVVGGAEMLDAPRPFAGTCGVLRWDRPADRVMATIFGYGLEHHLGIVHGDHRDRLVALASVWGVPVLRLGVDEPPRSAVDASASGRTALVDA